MPVIPGRDTVDPDLDTGAPPPPPPRFTPPSPPQWMLDLVANDTSRLQWVGNHWEWHDGVSWRSDQPPPTDQPPPDTAKERNPTEVPYETGGDGGDSSGGSTGGGSTGGGSTGGSSGGSGGSTGGGSTGGSGGSTGGSTGSGGSGVGSSDSDKLDVIFDKTQQGGGGDPTELNTQGGTLIAVYGPSGVRYYAEFLVYGVVLRYEIGDQAAFEALGAQFWAATISLSDTQFAARTGLDIGLIDERFGITETVQETMDRQLRIFGQEGLPQWQLDSPEVMLILMTGANEDWSEDRTLEAVSHTGAFRDQFPLFDTIRNLHTPGAGIAEAFDFYVNARDQIRQSITTYRGVGGAIDNLTIAGILGKGFDAEEAEDILIGEAMLRNMPFATDQINALLEFSGSRQRVSDDNLLDLILRGETERTPFELQELINDAIRAAAFQQQGIDLSPALAWELGTGESFENLNPTTLAEVAHETATNIFRFGHELQAEREGLNRDDLIRAMVNGDQSAFVSEKLAKFARRRSIEAQGLGSIGFQDDRGRLRLLGVSGL